MMYAETNLVMTRTLRALKIVIVKTRGNIGGKRRRNIGRTRRNIGKTRG